MVFAALSIAGGGAGGGDGGWGPGLEQGSGIVYWAAKDIDLGAQ